MCIARNERLTMKYILLFSSNLIEIRERHLTAQSLWIVLHNTSLNNIFNFLKEVNIFGRL